MRRHRGARGLDGIRAAFERLLTAIPDHRVTVEEVLADGDKVVARHTHYGTQTGPLGPVPATGKAVTIEGIEIFRVRDGRIAEVWALDDNATLFQQLGLLPAPGQAPR